MARKLGTIMALVGLMLLTGAAGGLAETYNLGQQGDSSNYTWRHGYPNLDYPPSPPLKDPDGIPWNAGTEFIAGAPTYDAGMDKATWKLGFYVPEQSYDPYYNLSQGSHTDPQGDNPGTFTVVFDYTLANPNFFLDGSKIGNVPVISSFDATITYTAKYTITDRYVIQEGNIIVTGHNSSDNNNSFLFTLNLVDQIGNHQNIGYISSATLVYPYNPVPLPGSVLLLASGLLGLACMARRRRK